MIQYLITDSKLRCPLCRKKVNLNSDVEKILKILEKICKKHIKKMIKMINDLKNKKMLHL